MSRSNSGKISRRSDLYGEQAKQHACHQNDVHGRRIRDGPADDRLHFDSVISTAAFSVGDAKGEMTTRSPGFKFGAVGIRQHYFIARMSYMDTLLVKTSPLRIPRPVGLHSPHSLPGCTAVSGTQQVKPGRAWIRRSQTSRPSE